MQPFEEWLDQDVNQSLQPLDLLMRRLTRAWQASRKASAVGDPPALSKGLVQLKAVLEQIPTTLGAAMTTTDGYDVEKYLADLFDREFKDTCVASQLTLEGQYPRYLIYPIRLQVDTRRMGVLMNGKLHRGLRVSRLVQAIRSERQRLLDRPFNGKFFLADLAAAHDSLVELESAKNRVSMSGHEVGLRQVYRRLVPMRQWRTEYPEGFFVLDLHRLLKSGETDVPDGRRIHLAPARDPRSNLTVLDGSEREVQLGLIAFREN